MFMEHVLKTCDIIRVPILKALRQASLLSLTELVAIHGFTARQKPDRHSDRANA